MVEAITKPSRFVLLPVIVFSVAILHAIGFVYGWYTALWFSMLLHALGGFFVGGIAYVYAERFGIFPLPGARAAIAAFLIVLGFAALAGVLWELFEFALDRIAPAGVYLAVSDVFADTMGDLAMDMMGAIAAFVFFRVTRRNG